MSAADHPSRQVSERYGRTRLIDCACGQPKMQVTERATGEPTLILCPTCDVYALNIILAQPEK